MPDSRVTLREALAHARFTWWPVAIFFWVLDRARREDFDVDWAGVQDGIRADRKGAFDMVSLSWAVIAAVLVGLGQLSGACLGMLFGKGPALLALVLFCVPGAIAAILATSLWLKPRVSARGRPPAPNSDEE